MSKNKALHKKFLIDKIRRLLNIQIATSLNKRNMGPSDSMLLWAKQKQAIILKKIEEKYGEHEYKLNTIIKYLMDTNKRKMDNIFAQESHLSETELKNNIDLTFFKNIDTQLNNDPLKEKKEFKSKAKNLNMSTIEYQKHLDSQIAWDTQKKEEKNLQKIWKEHKELAAKEAKHWKSIMVLSGDTSDIAQKEIEKYAQEQNKDLATLLTENDHSHTAPINQRVNAAIAQEIGKSLFNIDPEIDSNNNKKTEYNHKTGKLIQEEIAPGKFKFTVEKDSNFTGTLRVERKDENGNLLKNQVDVVIYKDGKPTKIFPATIGESRIANLGLLQKKAKGLVVTAKKQKLNTQQIYGINTEPNPPNYKPPPTPNTSNVNSLNGKEIG